MVICTTQSAYDSNNSVQRRSVEKFGDKRREGDREKERENLFVKLNQVKRSLTIFLEPLKFEEISAYETLQDVSVGRVGDLNVESFADLFTSTLREYNTNRRSVELTCIHC